MSKEKRRQNKDLLSRLHGTLREDIHALDIAQKVPAIPDRCPPAPLLGPSRSKRQACRAAAGSDGALTDTDLSVSLLPAA